MIVVNFSHPLTPQQRGQLEALTGQPIAEVRDVPVQLDHAQPFEAQVRERVDAAGLSADGWQTEAVLVNPPAYAPAAAALIAELHGRMGHFPAVIRIRPVPGTAPPRFEVAEIMDLQRLRDDARARRTGSPSGEGRHA